MQIETYECEELKNSDATTMAVDAEAIELINKLGLEGQKSLTNQETLTRDPYREMTKLEHFVWRTVCPESSLLSTYKLSPIPLRILQVAAYARELGIFEELEVWHPKQVVDDPLLIGWKKENKYSSRRHLIARWGEHLMSFEEATERAKQVFKAQFQSKIARIERELDQVKQDIQARVEESFAKESFDLPVFYNIAEL